MIETKKTHTHNRVRLELILKLYQNRSFSSSSFLHLRHANISAFFGILTYQECFWFIHDGDVISLRFIYADLWTLPGLGLPTYVYCFKHVAFHLHRQTQRDSPALMAKKESLCLLPAHINQSSFNVFGFHSFLYHGNHASIYTVLGTMPSDFYREEAMLPNTLCSTPRIRIDYREKL